MAGGKKCGMPGTYCRINRGHYYSSCSHIFSPLFLACAPHRSISHPSKIASSQGKWGELGWYLSFPASIRNWVAIENTLPLLCSLSVPYSGKSEKNLHRVPVLLPARQRITLLWGKTARPTTGLITFMKQREHSRIRNTEHCRFSATTVPVSEGIILSKSVFSVITG